MKNGLHWNLAEFYSSSFTVTTDEPTKINQTRKPYQIPEIANTGNMTVIQRLTQSLMMPTLNAQRISSIDRHDLGITMPMNNTYGFILGFDRSLDEPHKANAGTNS